MALEILKRLWLALNFFENTDLILVPQKIKKRLRLINSHCKVRIFHIYNNMQQPTESMQKTFDEIDFSGIINLYDTMYRKRKICQYYALNCPCEENASEKFVSYFFTLETSRNSYDQGNYKKSNFYLNKLLSNEETLISLPPSLIINVLRQASFITLKMEDIELSKDYIKACLCIYYYIINREQNDSETVIIPELKQEMHDKTKVRKYLNPNPNRDTVSNISKICILFMEILGDFSLILAETDNSNCIRTSKYVAKHMSNLLGNYNLKTLKAKMQQVQCNFKRTVYRSRMYFEFTDYTSEPDELWLHQILDQLKCKTEAKNPLFLEARILQLFTKHELSYSYYRPCPEPSWQAQWSSVQNNQNKINVTAGRYRLLYPKYETCINLITETKGKDHLLLGKLYYRLGLLHLQDKVIGPYLIQKRQLDTTLITEHLNKSISFINKGLAIERKVLGDNHYKYLQHRAMYLGDYFWVKYSLDMLTDRQKMIWPSLYEKCIDKIKMVFVNDDAHSVLRFCYTSLIRLYNYDIYSNLTDLTFYQNLLHQWEIDYNIKHARENLLTESWLSGINYIEKEWEIEEILKSNNKVKRIVRLLLEKFNIKINNDDQPHSIQ